jgi:two-component system, cell cycle sensor histidine kinase and response regulator CckA
MNETGKTAGSDLGGMAAARLAAIVESSADAIVSKQLDGTILSWNRAAERIFGYTAAEMIGASVFRLIPPDLHGEEHEILSRIGKGEQIQHYETTRVTKDGRLITISLTVSPVYDERGRIVGAGSIKRDITDAKRLQQLIGQASKMEAIGRLAGGLAHDFNNHLHALSGFAHFIGREPGLTPKARQDLLQIEKVAERMASLTHQLLAFARQQVLVPEVLDVGSTVADSIQMIQRLLGSNYMLTVNQTQGPRSVRADRAQLVQVLMNLVINARDAMLDGGAIIIDIDTIEVAPDQLLDRLKVPVEPGAYAILRVTDQGKGIAASEINRIFEPFYTTKEVGRGTGLGLATVEGIVSQSGGYIQVDSTLDQGTTFTILLPLTGSEPSKRMRPAAPVDAGRSWKGRILVVDDDEHVRTVISRLLQMEGYEVIVAGNGREALDLIDQMGGGFDLVISDIIMPVMGGIELTRRLGQAYSTIPIIYMSGHPRDPVANGDELISRRPFMHKPIGPEELLSAVRESIHRPRP